MWRDCDRFSMNEQSTVVKIEETLDLLFEFELLRATLCELSVMQSLLQYTSEKRSWSVINNNSVTENWIELFVSSSNLSYIGRGDEDMAERRRRAEATSRSPLLGNASFIVPWEKNVDFVSLILKMARRYGNIWFFVKISELQVWVLQFRLFGSRMIDWALAQ